MAKFTRKEIKAEPNLGKGALAALEAWLAGHGLTLRAETHTTTKTGVSSRGRPFDSYRPSPTDRKGSCKITTIVT